jgi:hypothetical protein
LDYKNQRVQKEINPNLETKKKLEEFFERVERILNENFEVIGKLLVPKVREHQDY